MATGPVPQNKMGRRATSENERTNGKASRFVERGGKFKRGGKPGQIEVGFAQRTISARAGFSCGAARSATGVWFVPEVSRSLYVRYAVRPGGLEKLVVRTTVRWTYRLVSSKKHAFLLVGRRTNPRSFVQIGQKDGLGQFPPNFALVCDPDRVRYPRVRKPGPLDDSMGANCYQKTPMRDFKNLYMESPLTFTAVWASTYHSASPPLEWDPRIHSATP